MVESYIKKGPPQIPPRDDLKQATGMEQGQKTMEKDFEGCVTRINSPFSQADLKIVHFQQ